MHGKTNNLKFTVMKKILLIALVSFFVLPAFSQKDSLYVDGMTWVTSFFSFINDSVDEAYPELYTCVIEGDSIVNGNKYKKLRQYYLDGYTQESEYDCTYLLRNENGKYMQYLSHTSIRPNGDYMIFDENLTVGDKWMNNDAIEYIGDTIFIDSPNKVRKYWKLQLTPSSSSRYRIMKGVLWIEGIGSINQPMSIYENAYDCTCYNMLLYCINPEGDTIYRNQKYIDWVEPFFKTGIPPVDVDDISISLFPGGISVNIGTDIPQWSATLYNSNGVCVAQREGEGSEMFLPTDSKGTHILVVKAGGRVVKKKIALR